MNKRTLLALAILTAITEFYKDKEELPDVYELAINPDTLEAFVIDGEEVNGWWDLPPGFTYDSIVDLEPTTIDACASCYFE